VVACEVELDKCVAVDTDDDGSFDDEICFGEDDDFPSPAAVGILDVKDARWQIEVTNPAGPGEGGTIGGCTVDDSVLDLTSTDCDEPFSLAPGETKLCQVVGRCSASFVNEATVTCTMCGGVAFETSDSDSARIECFPCEVALDKQVSCDDGATFVDVTGVDDPLGDDTESCIGWTGDDEIAYRFIVSNEGELDLGSCEVDDTHLGPIGSVASLLVGGTATFTTSLVECTEDLSNTGDVSCLCLPSQDGDLINPQVTSFGECDVSDEDTARRECQTPDLTVQKICDQCDPATDTNAVTVQVSNSGTAFLEDCVATDEVFANSPTCGTAGSGTAVPLVCNGGGSFDLGPGDSVQCTGSVDPSNEDDSCNRATVSCTIRDSGGKIHAESSEAICEPCREILGCRITAGGIVPDAPDLPFDEVVDPDMEIEGDAQIGPFTFGGQVGAPCGCIGCFDLEEDAIQGEWTHSRHKRKGRFHASDYASLVCDFDGGVCVDGVCVGSDRDGLECKKNVDCAPPEGPEPRPAPANIACFTGLGRIARNGGPRTDPVVFRVDVEDRGEPGGGQNAGEQDDIYRIRMWEDPGSDEARQALLDLICCQGNASGAPPVFIDDGGKLTHGNLQIHPVLPNTERGICPPPEMADMCFDLVDD
jgi:hypothetical protein